MGTEGPRLFPVEWTADTLRVPPVFTLSRSRCSSYISTGHPSIRPLVSSRRVTEKNLQPESPTRLTVNGLETVYPPKSSCCRWCWSSSRTKTERSCVLLVVRGNAVRRSVQAGRSLLPSHVPEPTVGLFGVGENSRQCPLRGASSSGNALNAGSNVWFVPKFR